MLVDDIFAGVLRESNKLCFKAAIANLGGCHHYFCFFVGYDDAYLWKI